MLVKTMNLHVRQKTLCDDNDRLMNIVSQKMVVFGKLVNYYIIVLVSGLKLER